MHGNHVLGHFGCAVRSTCVAWPVERAQRAILPGLSVSRVPYFGEAHGKTNGFWNGKESEKRRGERRDERGERGDKTGEKELREMKRGGKRRQGASEPERATGAEETEAAEAEETEAAQG